MKEILCSHELFCSLSQSLSLFPIDSAVSLVAIYIKSINGFNAEKL